SIGEPLYLDTVAALKDKNIKITGGRYGLSSKEFTPGMVKAVYDHLDANGAQGFTVGINDDVTNTSIPVNEEIISEAESTVRTKFWGYGSDGTVGACKNAIKIIGDNTDMNAQGYFVYDSKKSGGITISYLRFGKEKIRSPYLPVQFDFVALHKPEYIGRYDILEGIKKEGVFLINSPEETSKVFESLTSDMQKTIREKKIRFYSINALKIAKGVGLGLRINTVMLAAFFKISGVLPEGEAIDLLKKSIKKTYGLKGDKIVKMNWEAVDKASADLIKMEIPETTSSSAAIKKLMSDDAGKFEKNIIETVMRLKGDSIPVSEMPVDGSVPTATTKLEKRGVATEVPHWITDKCIQCNQCSFVCPHSAIRAKQISPENLKTAPENFTTLDSKTKNEKDLKYRLQIYAEDCTGCGNCVNTCPVGALEMSPIENERANGSSVNTAFFENLPDDITDGVKITTVKGSQFRKPLFEFSGACAGCGEAAYIKNITQLFGKRMIIANATGCSSIYGGTFPTIPYCKTKEGTGPAWANSLFEDNAEYGFGMRLAVDSNRAQLLSNIKELIEKNISPALTAALQKNTRLWQSTDSEAKKAAAVTRELLKNALSKAATDNKKIIAKTIELSDYFVDKSVWCFGGDGWAYDIGYGGLDHVLASKKNINVLVLDTEVYSNTGGQASKATQLGASAKFAISGKEIKKKDLGLIAMSYDYVYVASCAIGANKQQFLNAISEAESYDGPSLILCYSPCINHGLDMSRSVEEEKLAVECGYWPLYRFNPLWENEGKNPFKLEGKEPNGKFQDFIRGEVRFSSVKKLFPDRAEELFAKAEKAMLTRYAHYKKLAA
ncbi:MAG: pyruvate:ferredoxin (flavodoxin) oxidoreductase, partial [Elusimicrobiota bacterium]|nr:pyruvate:ferredoxin (flavodoxin) oxidoreductase [Elusimicrobiota bacterium]